ncbi:MAG: hypothetical protein RLZZ70_578, partial [Candidatus Parcubacteria bacterium]
MLVIFRLVLQDLWDFLVDECRALFMEKSALTVPLVTPPEPLQIDRTSPQLAIAPGVEKSSILPPVVPALLATVPTPLYLSEEKIDTVPVLSGSALDARVYYVHDTAGAVLLATPYVAYDGAVATVAYGAVVTVSQFVGNYAAVLVHGQTGYISKDSITPHRHDVWPLFVTGEQYDASSLSTMQTRRIIQDEFLCGLIGLPLQASEYVLLRLHQDNITIP